MQEVLVGVFGRVQMVMFRDFAQRKARKLKLVGYVRNLRDGSVEVLAQGEKVILERYLEKLHKGPILAHVERVEVIWRDPTARYDAFTLIR